MSAWTDVCNAVVALTCGHGLLISHSERPWASVTFTGTRHIVALGFTGLEAIDFGNAFAEELDRHEFTIAGQLVADAAVLERLYESNPFPRLTMKIELLLLERKRV